ncbi:MAG: DHA2 family efflux MFS transporter permease subunit [Thermosulfidibacteraceae bacterium]|jgi:DHA2 family multidrug resistance protein
MKGQDSTPLFWYPVSKLERVLITTMVMVGFFMAILDTTIVDVVLPKMMGPLSTDLYGIQWVVTSYMTAAAVGLIFVVSLAPWIGYGRTFNIGLAIFTIASFFCANANSLGEMILWRIIQGFGESFITASAQTILIAVYPPEKRGLAMGIFGLGVSFAPALGPTLGGFITEHFSWRWIFYINVPTGIINFLAVLLMLPKDIGKTGKFLFNFRSYTFLSIATVSLLILLSKGQQLGWFQSDLIGYLAFILVISFLLYFISELTSRTPLLDLTIYLIPEFGLTMGFHFFTLGFSMYQVFYLLPLYYENIKGLTTLQTGIHMLAFAAFIGTFSLISGYLSDRIRPERILVFSFIVYTITALLLLPRLEYYTPSLHAALYTVPMGIAMGTFFAPITRITLSNLGPRTGLGVVLLHYQRFIGASFGTAIATNNLEKLKNFYFEQIGIFQNQIYTKWTLSKAYNIADKFFDNKTAYLKTYALTKKAQEIMASSWAFQEVFKRSYFFALIGAIMLFILITRNYLISRQTQKVYSSNS